MIILNIIEEKNIILDKLTSAEFIEFINKFDISSVIVFGSVCNDDFNQLSDVDIALLGKDKIKLDSILDIELFLEKFLKRQIDVIDLRSSTLELSIRINILNSGNVVYTTDANNLFQQFCDETDRIFKENENFMYFRRMDILS